MDELHTKDDFEGDSRLTDIGNTDSTAPLQMMRSMCQMAPYSVYSTLWALVKGALCREWGSIWDEHPSFRSGAHCASLSILSFIELLVWGANVAK